MTKGTAFVGRDPSLDIVVQEESISRRHAELIYDGNNLQIIDLDSTNGTYVNDEKIKTKIISKEDLIRFGNIMFKYLPHGNIESVFHDELHNLAHIDGLTGCYNRKYITDYLETEIKRCKTLEIPLSIIIFDLDFFKTINDTYGHLAGDYILKETVRLIKDNVLRASDIIGRYGGEEFCIVVNEAGIKTAQEVAQRVRKAIEKNIYRYDDIKIKITISAGTSELNKKVDSVKQLIDEADKKLYQAKRDGRNRIY
ncbi:MAG: GGDEF domain-containing protein [Candidatus Pacebacteria bacterium]|nr:GGDEF domain-containing protein [Candidatus Paceibacterota bacterium]